AGASNSRICVDVSNGRAQSIIRDDGRGFDPQEILDQPYRDDHFGLRGMQERALALGGTCRIYSQPGAGTSIVIDLPANLQDHH
ncbi:MAG: sensor histidine kinase, partial [Candidatus Promineifilaceae bacterium]